LGGEKRGKEGLLSGAKYGRPMGRKKRGLPPTKREKMFELLVKWNGKEKKENLPKRGGITLQ